MAKKVYTPEEIISKLREAEVLQGQGQSISAISRMLGITDQTYYRWPRAAKNTAECAQTRPSG